MHKIGKIMLKTKDPAAMPATGSANPSVNVKGQISVIDQGIA